VRIAQRTVGWVVVAGLGAAVAALPAALPASLPAALPAALGASASHLPLRIGPATVVVRGGLITGSFAVRDATRGPTRPALVGLAIITAGRTRVLRTYTVPALARHRSARLIVHLAVPATLPAGRTPVLACAQVIVRPHRPAGLSGCREIATITVTRPGHGTAPGPTATTLTATTPTTTTPTTPLTTTTPTTTTPTTTTPTTVPAHPVSYQVDQPFEIDNGTTDQYWVSVPKAYDPANATPISLLVWMHGCEGDAQNDIAYWVDGSDPTNPSQVNANRDYLTIALDGASGGDACWDTSSACGDCAKVLAAIADVETHFNVDRRRIVLGGYSSGGDLAYRTIFDHASMFAGALVVNTTPFRDTGNTAAASLGEVSWHFNLVQLAHNQDQVYPLATVQSEIGQVSSAWGADSGRIQLLTTDGQHYDSAGSDGDAYGTEGDYLAYVLDPYIDAGWTAPPA
jgi:poly(3-hydroxybutyrate) depolymerase